MKNEQEIRDALKKCYGAVNTITKDADGIPGKCWMNGGMCCAQECSTIDTLGWVLGKEVDYTSKDLLAK